MDNKLNLPWFSQKIDTFTRFCQIRAHDSLIGPIPTDFFPVSSSKDQSHHWLRYHKDISINATYFFYQRNTSYLKFIC